MISAEKLDIRFDGQDASLPILGKPRESRNAVVYHSRHARFGGEVAVKRVLHDADSGVIEQYDAIRRLNSAFQGADGYRTVKPILVIPESGILVLEWIDGRSLQELLFDQATTYDQAVAYVERAARWLSIFHRTEVLPPCPLSCESLVKRLLPSDPVARLHPIRRRIHKLLTDSAPLLAGHDVPQVLVHGDYKPANVLYGDHETIAIDIAARHCGPNVADLGHFINCLRMDAYQPRGLRLLRWRGHLAKAFLAAYVAAGGDVPEPDLTWYRFHQLARLWLYPGKNGRRGASLALGPCILLEMASLGRRLKP
ncbi:MAG: phosphotransferase [Alphaproteobacteria bacterium]